MATETPKPQAAPTQPKPQPTAAEILSILKEVHAQNLSRGGRDDPVTMKLSDILERLESPKP